MADERGTGTINQLPSGAFRLRFCLPDGTRRSFTRKTREELESLQRGILATLEEQQEMVCASTLSGLSRRFLRHRAEMGSRSTKSEESRWNKYILAASFAEQAVSTVTTKQVREWTKQLKKTKTSRIYGKESVSNGNDKQAFLSRQTIKHCLNLLRAFFAWTIDEGLLQTNPAKGVEPPKQETTVRGWTFLNPEEQVSLIRAVPEDQRHLVAFALGTGLRLGEQWSLRLEDVYLGDEPHIVVRYGGPNKAPTKTGEIRRVELFGWGLQAAAIAVEQANRLPNPLGLLFPLPSGAERRWRKPPKSWKRWVEQAGLKRRVRWHDLRHSCASSLICGWWVRPWTLVEVSKHLGHSSLSTTERYAHLTDTVTKRAARETRQIHQTTKWTQDWTRSGHALPPASPDSPMIPLRATVDSNHRPLAPEAERKPVNFQQVTSKRVHFMSTQSVELLRLVAKGDERANEYACALAAAVLADPLTQLAQAVIGGAPLAQAVRMAELILKQPDHNEDEQGAHVANLPIRS